MSKYFKLLIIISFEFAIFVSNESAKSEEYFINGFGVRMTSAEYDYLLEYFDKDFVNGLTQEFFYDLMEDINCITSVSTETIYVETIYI